MRRRPLALAAGAAAALVAGTLAVVLPGGASASPSDELQAAKSATSRYHSLAQAKADGYAPLGGAAEPCISSPAGAMGVHYANPALIAEPGIDPSRPEILNYLPKKNGQLELVAVEYFMPDADQNLATSGDRPSVFGRGLDGPMPGHNPTMGVHYDLHVWLFETNPNGLFAPFNPALSCTP